MGNSYINFNNKNQLKEFEAWVEQNPELSGRRVLFENKIFRTFSFNIKSLNNNIIIKAYLKEKDT